MKQVIVSFLTLWMVGIVTISTVAAQEALEVKDLWHDLQQANKDIHSMMVEGNFQMEVTPVEGEQALVDTHWHGKYNLEPFIGDVTAEFNVFGAGLDTKKDINAVLDQETLYYQIDGQQWAGMDVSEYTRFIVDQINYSKGQVATNAAMEDTLLKYINYEETENEHIFTLKENIDGGQMYEDLDQAGFFEEVKKAALDQSTHQPEVEEVPQPTPQEIQEAIDRMYSRENFIQFFQSNPHYLLAYDKETKQLTRFESDMTVRVEDFTTETEETSEVPNDQRLQDVRIVLKVTFSHHGETFDISIPAGVEINHAPTMNEEVAEPTQEETATSEDEVLDSTDNEANGMEEVEQEESVE